MKSIQNKHNTTILVLTSLTSAFLFGAATPASKALLGGIQAQTLAGLLYLGAAIGILPVVIREQSFRYPWRTDRQTLLLLTGAIVLGGIIGPLLLLLGLRIASSGSVALWLNLEFVATVTLGHFVFKEHFSKRGWVAAGGTLLAAVLLAGEMGSSGVLSIVLVAAGCLCWGFDNHFTALIDGITPAQTTMWKGLVAGITNLMIGGFVFGGTGRPSVVVFSLLVGAISYGLSITLYVTAAQGLGASRSQMIFSTAPFFGLLLSVMVLGESFTWTQALAAGLIAASLLILFSEKHKHIHRHDSMYHQHPHGHNDRHHQHDHRESSSKARHVHWHDHEPEVHTHKHWPDLHHRHDHEDDDEGGSSKK